MFDSDVTASSFYREIAPPARRLRICGSKKKLITLKPGESSDWQCVGSGSIRNMWLCAFAVGGKKHQRFYDRLLHVNHNIRALIQNPEFYRKVWIHFTFDDADTPQVSVPFADFFLFGSGVVQDLRSQFVNTMKVPPMYRPPGQGSFNCRFPMPFAKNFRVSFENRNNVSMWLEGVISWDEQAHDDEIMHFHTAFIEKHCDKEPILFADIEGKQGNFFGLSLFVDNKDKEDRWHEAPEHFIVDGDEQSMLQGTGGEVYFGSCWGYRQTWDGAYFGIPVAETYSGKPYTTQGRADPAGRFSAYRFHPHDPVSFNTSLRGFFAKTKEHRLPHENFNAYYRAASFYYARKV